MLHSMLRSDLRSECGGRRAQKEFAVVLYRGALLRAITFFSFTAASKITSYARPEKFPHFRCGPRDFYILYKSDFTVRPSRACRPWHSLSNLYVNSARNHHTGCNTASPFVSPDTMDVSAAGRDLSMKITSVAS